MNNEVICVCPECKSTKVVYVTQYLLGFGNFDLRYLETFSELDNEQLASIREELKEIVWCSICSNSFIPLSYIKDNMVDRVKKIFWEE